MTDAAITVFLNANILARLRLGAMLASQDVREPMSDAAYIRILLNRALSAPEKKTKQSKGKKQ